MMYRKSGYDISKSISFALILILLNFVTACGGGGGGGSTADVTPPDAPVISSPSDGELLSDRSPVIIGTAESGSSVELFDTDGTTSLGTGTATDGNWSITMSLLSEGVHSISAKAKDGSGNVSAASATVSITIDTVGPTVQASSEFPLNNAVDVVADDAAISVYATFDEELLSSSVSDTTFLLKRTSDDLTIPGTVVLSGSGTTPIFNPSADLDDNTQYTATLTAGITDLAGNATTAISWSFTTGTMVKAYYLLNGVNWNDYVRNDNTSAFNATGAAADGTETGGYSAVIHGGEMRSVEVQGHAACGDLTATDSLGAFYWTCDASTNPVRMVSTALKESVNLSDLLDFVTPGWLENSVTVTGTGAGLPLTTVSTKWWSNPVIDTTGGDLAIEGAVYIVTVDPTEIYEINANKIALVIKPGYVVTGLGASGYTVLRALGKNFLWLEGKIDATDVFYGVYWVDVHFSFVRNLEVMNPSSAGIYVNAAMNNKLADISLRNSGGNGFDIYNSNKNEMTRVTANNAANNGVVIVDSMGNNFSNMTMVNNSNGIAFYGISANNILKQVETFNNNTYGIVVAGVSNRIQTVIAANNGYGVWIDGTSNVVLDISVANSINHGVLVASTTSTIMNLTSINNGGHGLTGGGKGNIYTNVVSGNNGSAGIRTSAAVQNTFSNTIFSNNEGYGVKLENSSGNNYFTRLLAVGNNLLGDCYVKAESTDGDLRDDIDEIDVYHGGLCLATTTALSDFTLTSGVTLSTSFVGKVTSDDTVNVDDVSGTVGFPADPTVFDWSSYENGFRGWGIDGSAFPSADHRGAWTAGMGRIWDLSLLSSDILIRGVLSKPLLGDSLNTIEHKWLALAADQAACDDVFPGSVWNAIDDCRSTFLVNASEIAGDDIGNDNGLCETNETCLYMPNLGSYQGHGATQSAGTFVDGDTITGVTILEYATNGY